MNLSEAVIELRKEYCHECNSKFTNQEIENGHKCEICKETEELGKTVANLKD